MFAYAPVVKTGHYNYPTENARSIEHLEELVKAGEVDRVLIPHTYYNGMGGAYGGTMASESNYFRLKEDYPRSFKDYGNELSISARQFMRSEYKELFRELIVQLAEEYPLYDDEDYSRRTYDALEKYLIDELGYELNNSEREDMQAIDWTDELIYECLSIHRESLCWYDIVNMDNDDYTPYMKKTDFAEFLAKFISIVVEDN